MLFNDIVSTRLKDLSESMDLLFLPGVDLKFVSLVNVIIMQPKKSGVLHHLLQATKFAQVEEKKKWRASFGCLFVSFLGYQSFGVIAIRGGGMAERHLTTRSW